MTGITGCCARATCGPATATLPSMAMNWRRLTGLTLYAEDYTLPHRLNERGVFCSTASLAR